MGFIIGLIVSVAIMTAFVAYFLTKDQPPMKHFVEESPLQKVLNKSLEKSAKDIKVKDAVVVKPTVTKETISQDLRQLIDQSNELAKELDKIPTQDLVAYAANISTQGKEPVKSVKKRKYYPKSPKGKA